MSDRKLMVLGSVAAVMVIWAVFQSKMANRTSSPDKVDVQFFQGLSTDKIATITLGQAEKTVTLKRQGKIFAVEDKDNYPALTAKINNLLATLLDVRIKSLITSNPANHLDLEVTEEKAQHVVRFLDESGELITGIIVGKKDNQAGGSYVRQVSLNEEISNKVYVASDVPWLQGSAMTYIDKEIFKVEKSDIVRVTVTSPEGSYSIKADEVGNIALEAIPEGKKVKGTDYEQVFTAVTNLEFADVQKESEKTAGLDFNRKYICELKDSTVATFQLAVKDDKTYAKCMAEFTDNTLPTKSQIENASEEELKDHEAKLLARDAAKEFTQKHSGWIYEIVDNKADNLTKSLSELLEDLEPEQPAEEKSEPVQPDDPVSEPAPVEAEQPQP